ncbi:MAG: tRNA pseudouridine(38-40) synthase TruA [Actinomycetes bacterium]
MGGTARWRLTVAYRGTAFHGFAAQPGLKTVAGELAEALKRVARTETAPVIVCAGRTDAGVHATAQVVHVDLPDPMPGGRDGPLGALQITRSLNRQLGGDVSVTSVRPVSSEFDARYSARWRRYRYLIHEGLAPDPMLSDLAWNVSGELDVRAMSQAIGAFIGTHDFRSFCRKVPGASASEPIVRLVTDASVAVVDHTGVIDIVEGRLIRVEIQARAFCHQMVRSIVGQLVDVGLGRSNTADLVALLRSQDRRGAAPPAPPQGLCLIGVGYDDYAEQGGHHEPSLP